MKNVLAWIGAIIVLLWVLDLLGAGDLVLKFRFY